MAGNTIDISDADFSSLERFPLLWRWTDPSYVVLSDDELSEIRPLGPSAAEKVNSLAKSYLRTPSFRLSPDLFEDPVECNTSGEPSDGRRWLENVTRSIDPSVEVVVTWNDELAVTTKLWLFMKYWDDFCYPISDDTTVFPFDVEWAIQYWHEEVLYFANCKSRID